MRADNSNLPIIDAFMVALFFKNNAGYYVAELKNVKTACGKVGRIYIRDKYPDIYLDKYHDIYATIFILIYINIFF